MAAFFSIHVYGHRANVTVTDLPEFVELMSDNIALNKDVISGSVLAKSLTW